MATRDWIGTDSGNEGDWSVAANWSGATVPITGDIARFLTGSQSVVAGKDQSGVNLLELIVTSGYSGDIGSSTGKMEIGATTLSFQGRGNAWFDVSTGSFNYDAVYVQGGVSGRRLYITGNVAAAHIMEGFVTFESGTVTEAWLETIGTQLEVPQVTITDADFTTLHVLSGVVTQNGSGTISAMHILAGTVTSQEGTTTNVTVRGGLFVKNSPTTVAELKMYKGSCDASQDDRAKTFTDIETHVGMMLNLQNAPDNVVVTNPIKIVGGRDNIKARTLSTTGI